MKKIKKKKSKISITEKILRLGKFLKTPRTAMEIKKELKDSTGYNFLPKEIHRSLLRLLRRGKIKRKKEGKFYKYHNG